jgi:hypothetical protein
MGRSGEKKIEIKNRKSEIDNLKGTECQRMEKNCHYFAKLGKSSLPSYFKKSKILIG